MSRTVSVTPERKNTLLRKVARLFHIRPFMATLKNTVSIPMTDLYHPEFRKHSHYPSISRRYRGLLSLSMEACTGCKKCERICPNNTIMMHEREVDGKVYRFPGYFAARCMFCGLCEEACDRQFAIRHTNQFEDAGYNRMQTYYPPERMWDMWDRHMDPKVKAGIIHASVPDKKRFVEGQDVIRPLRLTDERKAEIEAAEVAAKAAKK